jgi:hypothetical protein
MIIKQAASFVQDLLLVQSKGPAAQLVWQDRCSCKLQFYTPQEPGYGQQSSGVLCF